MIYNEKDIPKNLLLKAKTNLPRGKNENGTRVFRVADVVHQLCNECNVDVFAVVKAFVICLLCENGTRKYERMFEL